MYPPSIPPGWEFQGTLHLLFHPLLLISLAPACSFRYQNWIRMFIWLFFLFVYSQSVQQPLETQLDPSFDAWEIILYVMGLAYTLEGKRFLLIEDPADA